MEDKRHQIPKDSPTEGMRCPCCGGKVEFRVSLRRKDRGLPFFLIGCEDFSCDLNWADGFSYDSEEIALAAWHERCDAFRAGVSGSDDKERLAKAEASEDRYYNKFL